MIGKHLINTHFVGNPKNALKVALSLFIKVLVLSNQRDDKYI